MLLHFIPVAFILILSLLNLETSGSPITEVKLIYVVNPKLSNQALFKKFEEYKAKLNQTNQALLDVLETHTTQVLDSVLSDLEQIQEDIILLQNKTEEISFAQEEIRKNITSGLYRIPKTKGIGFNNTVVDLYYRPRHSGPNEKVDFTNCPEMTSCCRNLVTLSENSESINTHNSCVILYYENDCGEGGPHKIYRPGTSGHVDFGSDKNKYKSIGTCYYY